MPNSKMTPMYVDNTLYGSSPKLPKAKKCKYCGEKYKHFNIYNGFCSWTCKARYLREQEERKNNGTK